MPMTLKQKDEAFAQPVGNPASCTPQPNLNERGCIASQHPARANGSFLRLLAQKPPFCFRP
jgi:hypothetical protein